MRFKLSRAPVTAALLVIIALVFMVEWATGAVWDDNLLAQMGGILPIHVMIERREYWRVISGMFLHAGVLHWAMNSWALYQLGMLFEIMFGSARLATIYFATGIIASIASAINLAPGAYSVGASGAVFGILGAFIFSIRRSPQWRHEPWTKSLLSQLMFWAGLNLILGASVPQIDNTAHIAGMISGLILGFIPHRVPPPPPSRGVIDVMPHDDGLTSPPN